MGWHKVGWVFCFLLVALLRMALLYINPSDSRYACFGIALLDIMHFAWLLMATATYNVVECMFCIFEYIAEVSAWLVYELIPDTLNYWRKRACLFRQYYFLTWQWWLVMIMAHWNDPGPDKGKVIAGTYWNIVHECLYTLKDQFKQLTRERWRLDRDSELFAYYDSIWNAAINVIAGVFVYFFAMGYFIARILRYKAGLLVSNIKEKRPWKSDKRKDDKLSMP